MSEEILASTLKLQQWLERHNYEAYDPFDGLNSYLYPATFESKFLRQVLIQVVKRSPWNLRPILGIKPAQSAKGIAYIAKGYLWLYKATGESVYAQRAKYCLDWLVERTNQKYSGDCWGNHFDCQTRGYFLKAGEPTIVWSALTGQAFMMAYKIFEDDRYLKVADSICQFIMNDLEHVSIKNGICISYIPSHRVLIHNSSLLGAALLAKLFRFTGNQQYLECARKAVVYACEHQLPNNAWYYGEEDKFHWIDNFHTGYNLNAILDYQQYSGDHDFSASLQKGYDFYRSHFFTPEAAPKYYHDRMYLIDIQCVSQSIETLVCFGDLDQGRKVAMWGIRNMQDSSGYFYFRKHRFITNRTPMLHWGQGTMFCALARLYHSIGDR